MSTSQHFQELSRQSYREFHQDGIIDILVGASLVGFGLWLELDIALFAFTCWLSVGFYKELKKRVTIPRFGFVRFEKDRAQFILGLLVAFLITLLLLGARFLILERSNPNQVLAAFLRKNHPYIMSSIGAILMIAFGVWRGLNRFLAYGLIFLCILGAFFLAEFPGQFALLVGGGSMLVAGLFLIARFIRNQPLLDMEGDHAQ